MRSIRWRWFGRSWELWSDDYAFSVGVGDVGMSVWIFCDVCLSSSTWGLVRFPSNVGICQVGNSLVMRASQTRQDEKG